MYLLFKNISSSLPFKWRKIKEKNFFIFLKIKNETNLSIFSFKKIEEKSFIFLKK